MDYTCSTCGEKVEGDLIIYIDHTQEHIIEEIKAKHPEWVEGDGVCLKCINYFKSQIQGENE